MMALLVLELTCALGSACSEPVSFDKASVGGKNKVPNAVVVFADGSFDVVAQTRSVEKEHGQRGCTKYLSQIGRTVLVPCPEAEAGALKVLDTRNDGTVSLTEAQAGASKVYAGPRPDGGTLGDRFAAAGLDAAVLKDADFDNDSTVDANEYATVIERQFKVVDSDNDGTLDEQELSSPPGAALLKLILEL